MTQSANPLRAFFRQPAIYIRLPSDGQFWPPGSLEMPENRELPVLPMTAMDEITYRTPDALFNGSATVAVIQSCVPNIKNAWHLPNCDFATILSAIRIASYGKVMPISTECPECKTQNDYELDLQDAMAQIEMSNYGLTVETGDLTVSFRPLTYQQQTEINMLQFEQSRLIAMLPSSDLSEDEKTKKLNAAIKEITDITVKAMCRSIQSIHSPQALVTESEYIHDFLMNCDRNVFNAIRDTIIELKQKDDFRPIKMQCPDCKKEYEQQITLDTTSFFATAS